VRPRQITFDRPAPLMSMNERLHWSKQRRHARLWRAAACWATIHQVPVQRVIARRLPPCTVTVVLPVHDRRRRDPHNYFPVVKAVIDGLVDAGLWPDDTPEWVTTTEPRLRLADPADEIVIVELTERAPS
jgi:crossover junction endodeoxyribonuclease RusA